MKVANRAVSRRQFLTGSLAAGIGAALARQLAAAPAAVDPHRFALLADTHIAESLQQENRKIRPGEQFPQARKGVVALPSRPAAVIISGDCAYLQGNSGDYASLKDLVRPLLQAGLPVHYALGNHDHRENFWNAFPNLRQSDAARLPGRHVAIVESPHANWFILDSLDRTNVVPGELGKEQLAWLAKSLDERPNTPALIVAHHHVVPHLGKLSDGLRDADALLDVLVSRPQVKAYFFGHTHCWSCTKLRGLHLVNIPTLVWVFDPKQPRGWVDAQLKPDGATLALHALDSQHAEAGKVVELAWR